jgi:hypothetical protein
VKKLYIDKRPIEWDYYQQFGGNYQITIEATEDEINKLNELNNIFVSYNLDFQDFEFGLEILKRDADFKAYLYDYQIEEYFKAFRILKLQVIEQGGSKYNPLTAPLRDGNKISINSNYIHTELNLEKETFFDALRNDNHRVNECWLNAITELYGDTVLGSNRREVLTREKLLTLIGKDEETIKNGCSIDDVMPFFEKFAIPIRIYNDVSKCIFKYDPLKRNFHFRVFYGLIKDNHIYTMNYNLKELEQVEHKKSEESQASSNYFIAKEDIKKTYIMIDTIDNIIEIIKSSSEAKETQIINFKSMSKKDKIAYQRAKQDLKDKTIYDLIYKTNDLNGLLYEIKKLAMNLKSNILLEL